MNTRFALFLVSLAGALIAVKAIRNAWMAAGVIVAIFIFSGIIEQVIDAAIQLTGRSIQDRTRERAKGK